ncbi:MAG: hydroxyethylthiazole kinase [Bacteroidales bacterium]|nr:hydroxyethylthiazole kinase [Bacteroidales bacterium]
MTDMPDLAGFVEDCRLIRRTAPVIHNITNYVAMSMSANALLAIGASPLMSSESSEIEDISRISSALVINIGCLEERQKEAMKIAARVASISGKPWVLDPAGAGASRFRTDTARELAEMYGPSVIRGNASEIMALDGLDVASRGVDSAHGSKAALEAATHVAREFRTVVSVSGETDYITDGQKLIGICNGNAMMPVVTAMGCTASAITAAFASVDGNFLRAAAFAMALMGVAGEKAAAISPGPGSLAMNFTDALYGLEPEEAAELIRYE